MLYFKNEKEKKLYEGIMKKADGVVRMVITVSW